MRRNLSSLFRCPKSKDGNLLNEIICSTATKSVLVVGGGWKSHVSAIQVRKPRHLGLGLSVVTPIKVYIELGLGFRAMVRVQGFSVSVSFRV